MSSSTRKMLQAAAGVGGDFYPYTVDYSARFDGASDLTRTPSASDRRTWTFSAFVKRSKLSADYEFIFGADLPGGGQYGILGFDPTDNLFYQDNNGSAFPINKLTTAVFRDVSAYYHVVVVADTTNATAEDRLRIYVNGDRITSWTTNATCAQNYETYVNTSGAHYIGANPATSGTSEFYNGYLSQACFIDGQALDPTSFGENKNGVWVPKDVSGLTFGTNGFYLDFSNSAALGTDASGNGNNWTPSGLTSSDQMIDTPTNNFATLNPLEYTIDVAYSEGNLKCVQGATYRTVAATQFVSSGKWYFESYGTGEIGVVRLGAYNPANRFIVEPGEYIYNWYEGNKGNNNVGTSYGDAWTTTDIVSCVLDLDAGTIEFFKNNVSQGIAFTGLPSGYYSFGIGHANTTQIANFGQDSSFAGNKTAQGNTDANGNGDFYYAPPTGALALCAANLSEPTIGPNSATTSGENFNAVIYTGTGATRSVTGVGFQPDFTWIKRRSAFEGHWLTDAVRGVTKGLYTNDTLAEATRTDQIQSFDSDGFTLGADAAGYTNVSGQTYVGWNWKANGSGVSNTDGSVTSTVSANQDAGFSIISATTPASGNFTVGHGLTQAPEFVVVKDRNNAFYWAVYHSVVMTSVRNYLLLNDTRALSTSGGDLWGSALPTSSVIGLSAGNAAGASSPFICYAFHSVEGFSSFGKYTGNGSADGPFVYTGFRPAFVIVKSATSAYSWMMHDSARSPSNQSDEWFYANFANAEETQATEGLDILSNGFKIRTTNVNWNHSGQTIIYMAFAENPFKYANAR